MNSIKVCEYSRSRSFHDDLILQDQASGERSQDHWSSGYSTRGKHFSFHALRHIHIGYIVIGQVSLTATVTCSQYYLLSCGADGAR